MNLRNNGIFLKICMIVLIGLTLYSVVTMKSDLSHQNRPPVTAIRDVRGNTDQEDTNSLRNYDLESHSKLDKSNDYHDDKLSNHVTTAKSDNNISTPGSRNFDSNIKNNDTMKNSALPGTSISVNQLHVPINIVYNPVSDYLTYPCITGLSLTRGQLGQCVRTVNVTMMAEKVRDIECVNLNLRTPTPICIHDPRIDRYVSAYVFAAGMWEGQLVKNFTDALDQIPDVHVLDVGCNIGVYTLAAAKAGKRVVSIDANTENLRLLAKSLTLGGLTENVTLIWNAISDKYSNVSLKPADMNIGAFSISNETKDAVNDVTIQTILLNDIEHLFTNKPVAIKMDIELFELHALRGGLSFFTNVNVRFAQIEMDHHRGKESFEKITSFFKLFGFKPFYSCLGDMHLENIPTKEWPLDVCFLK